MNNYFDGFDRMEVTLHSTKEVAKGKAVEFMEAYTVDRALDGHNFVGVCTYAENYMASIQLRGYARVAYTGTAPDCGYIKLTGNGKGGVKVDDNGRYVLVTDVDTEDNTCGIIL